MSTEFRVFMASRLREERERLGLKQAQMAELGSVPTRTYQDWEREISTVSVEFLMAASAHNLDVLYVVTGRRTPQVPGVLSEEETDLLSSYAQADDSGRAALQAVADLAKRAPNAKGKKAGNTVTIGGDVGQAIAGDQTNTAPVTFSVGKSRK